MTGSNLKNCLCLVGWIKDATNTKKWKAEAPGLCCSGGKVDIHKVLVPTSVLKELISRSQPSSKHFLNYSRQYNTIFQMTSFGAKKKNREGSFMPTFKVQGQIYHLIGTLLPAECAHPEFCKYIIFLMQIMYPCAQI